MRTLIVLTHPAPESLCHALKEAVVAGLGGVDPAAVRVLDLYEERRRGFDPVLEFGSVDGRRRRDMKDDPAMEAHRQALLWAEHLVLVHPLWWGRAPALFEGWLDRLLASGFAYTNRGTSSVPVPLLTGKQATVIFTADASGWIDRLYYQRQYQRRIGRFVLALCGFRNIRFLPVYGVKRRQSGELSRAVDRVRRHFGRLSLAAARAS